MAIYLLLNHSSQKSSDLTFDGIALSSSILFVTVAPESFNLKTQGYVMNYAKMISAMVLLGALNIAAMGSEAISPDKTKIAKIEKNQIRVIDKSGTLLEIFDTGNRYTWFGSVTFKDDTTLVAHVVGGISPDDLHEMPIEYKLNS
jgi:hypothetical protein